MKARFCIFLHVWCCELVLLLVVHSAHSMSFSLQSIVLVKSLIWQFLLEQCNRLGHVFICHNLLSALYVCVGLLISSLYYFWCNNEGVNR